MDSSRSTILGKRGRRTGAKKLGKKLHEAIKAGNHDLVKKLIAEGAPLEAAGVHGHTSLQAAAATSRNAQIVRLLLAEGADKDAVGAHGLTPLLCAAASGNSYATTALLAAGADASLQRKGYTALTVAAEKGHARVLAAFIRHGVNVNHAGRFGTALHHAARKSKVDAIDLLVAAGADTEAGDSLQCTPLHNAALGFGLEATAALLKHGADINARVVAMGITPLHLAAAQAGKRGAVEMVDLLLRREADEAATDNIGQAPADVVGNSCSDVQEAGGVERVRTLLANAPAARAWHRRGLLVAARARPQMVRLAPSTRSRREWMDLMGRVQGLREEGVFRTIVGYL